MENQIQENTLKLADEIKAHIEQEYDLKNLLYLRFQMGAYYFKFEDNIFRVKPENERLLIQEETNSNEDAFVTTDWTIVDSIPFNH